MALKTTTKRPITRVNVWSATQRSKTQWSSLADTIVFAPNALKWSECKIASVQFADRMLKNF